MTETVTPTRKLQVHITFDDRSHGKALIQTYGMGVTEDDQILLVDSQEHADLIIFDDVRQIEEDYRTERRYFFVQYEPRNTAQKLPKNVTVCHSNMIQLIASAMAEVMAEVAGTPPPGSDNSLSTDVDVPLREDALSILVIDDTPEHLVRAKHDLAGHNVTTVNSFRKAMDILQDDQGYGEFEVVLTDLYLPMSSQTMGNNFELGKLVPYGLLIRDEAARHGATAVAVVSNINHHDDPLAAAFDYLHDRELEVENATCRMLHARLHEDGTKDWAYALKCAQGGGDEIDVD